MPRIIPIKELKDTSKISAMVHESDEPVFVTKNGYGDMVMMSMDVYEQSLYVHDLSVKLTEAERDFAEGKASDAFVALDRIQAKYDL